MKLRPIQNPLETFSVKISYLPAVNREADSLRRNILTAFKKFGGPQLAFATLDFTGSQTEQQGDRFSNLWSALKAGYLDENPDIVDWLRVLEFEKSDGKFRVHILLVLSEAAYIGAFRKKPSKHSELPWFIEERGKFLAATKRSGFPKQGRFVACYGQGDGLAYFLSNQFVESATLHATALKAEGGIAASDKFIDRLKCAGQVLV